MAKARKDDRGRALRKGEVQRASDKRYMYTYTDPLGRRKFIYAQDLATLREKEEQLVKDQLDGLDVYVLFNVSMSILHNTADAEDAVQETFVRIISNLSKIDCANEKRSKAYIFVVTRNICYDILRKKHKVVFLEDDRELVDTNAVDNTEILTDVLTVQNNIKMLSPLLKNVSTLYYAEEFTVEQISGMLDISAESVYKAISRARNILLQKQGDMKND